MLLARVELCQKRFSLSFPSGRQMATLVETTCHFVLHVFLHPIGVVDLPSHTDFSSHPARAPSGTASHSVNCSTVSRFYDSPCRATPGKSRDEDERNSS
jgi:hypothetical protein